MTAFSEFNEDLPITVRLELHEAMAAECGAPFAISYLCGAIEHEGVLLPRTNIARERLLAAPKALRVLTAFGLHVGRALTPAERTPIPAVEELRRRERAGKAR